MIEDRKNDRTIFNIRIKSGNLRHLSIRHFSLFRIHFLFLEVKIKIKLIKITLKEV